jgi:hypothetical protein
MLGFAPACRISGGCCWSCGTNSPRVHDALNSTRLRAAASMIPKSGNRFSEKIMLKA